MPTTVNECTIKGRLSFPHLTHADAVIADQKSKYAKKTPQEVSPNFNFLVDEDGKEKLRRHLIDEFIPAAVQRRKDGADRNVLTDAQAKQLISVLEDEDWADAICPTPIKAVPEKSVGLMEEAVAMIRVNGRANTDIVQKAVVTGEGDMASAFKDRVKYPALVPIDESSHDLYPGCWATATLNLYAFVTGKTPGITAQATVLAWKEDAPRFGGGVDADEESMFED